MLHTFVMALNIIFLRFHDDHSEKVASVGDLHVQSVGCITG